jgi:hypothetical protein
MTPFAVRLPTVMAGAGKVGYLYAKGEADGSWRITDKELGKHELVGACDTPEAMIPRLRDHLEAWCGEQAAIVAHNLGVLDRAPERRQGFRPGWKAREYQIEREALKRSLASAARVLQAIASVAQRHGWPIIGYDGPLLDLTAAGVLVERDPARGAA